MKHIKLAAFALAAIASAAGCTTVPPPEYIVRASASGEEAKMLAGDVASGLRGEMVEKGYLVRAQGARARAGAKTVNVDVAVGRRTMSTLDVWRVYEGTANVTVSEGGRILGEKTFTAQGARADNERDAEKSVAQKLEPQIFPWLDKTANPKIVEPAAPAVK